MVEIQFYKLTKNETPSVAATEDKFVFSVPKPTVIQPAEIIKIQTGLVVKVPKGFVLTLSPHPDLSEKAADLFPSIITVDSYAPEKELALAVRNSGRNQLNLLAGFPFAVGYVSEIRNIETGDFEPDVIKNPVRDQSRPQKKNPFSFEVK